MADEKDASKPQGGVARKKRRSFRRQEWFRRKRLGVAWRRPKGRHSKRRQARVSRAPIANIGFGREASLRGTVKGYAPVVVWNAAEVRNIDAKKGQAAVIASGAGVEKALEIAKAAKEKGVVILNSKRVKAAEKFVAELEKKRAERKVADAAKKEKGKEVPAKGKTAEISPKEKTEEVTMKVKEGVKAETKPAAHAPSGGKEIPQKGNLPSAPKPKKA